MNKEIKTRFICKHCGSDNIQIKVWVRPNENNELVDDNETGNTGLCDDCEMHSIIVTKPINVRSKIIGFQVDLDENQEMHPDMSASFCVYSLPQVKQMMRQDYNRWNLLAIYDDDINKPTFMFNGDPRNPDDTVLDVMLNK